MDKICGDGVGTGVFVCWVKWGHVLFDPLFLDCHAIGNNLPGDHDELGFVRLNRTCGRSTSAWFQLGNGLRIVNGGNGLWKRLHSRMGHALDDDADDGEVGTGQIAVPCHSTRSRTLYPWTSDSYTQ